MYVSIRDFFSEQLYHIYGVHILSIENSAEKYKVPLLERLEGERVPWSKLHHSTLVMGGVKYYRQ